MKKATIEILHEGETVLGSRTAGAYFVREYEDGEEKLELFTSIFMMQLIM